MSTERNGLACPQCRSKMAVYYSRPGAGMVKRRRVCGRCQYAETTHERPVGVPRKAIGPYMEPSAEGESIVGGNGPLVP